MTTEITVPNLGDIDEVEVIEICVSEGDEVSAEDTMIVIESDKASMDVPAGVAGTVQSIAVQLGDMVSEGTLIGTLAGGEAASETSPKPQEAPEPPASEPEQEAESVPEKVSEPAAVQSPQTLDVLVPDIGEATNVVVIEVAIQAGQEVEVNDLLVVLESDKASMEISAEHAGEIQEVCVKEDDEVEKGTVIAKILTTTEASVKTTSTPEPAPVAEARPEPKQGPTQEPPSEKRVDAPSPKTTVYAGPATRRLARELGVDLSEVTGSGQRGRIVKDDVKAFVKDAMTGEGTGTGLPTLPQVDFAKYGPVRSESLTRIRQRGAVNLHTSWVNLPHVTQHDEADVTDLEAFRSELKSEAEARGVRVTPLSFIVKACCRALAENPEFNSSLHPNGQELIIKEYINIGMAVDTPEGLVVPVIRDADKKDIWALSEDIATLAQKARDKKLGLDDLSGGTFSISSLGALGGTGFTPIVNAPEVAILGVSRLATKPVWNGSEFLPRKILPLSLSYDHRVINGADGGRFMVRITELLGDLRRLAI